MPVTPEYKWYQTEVEVVIDVDIKGITRKKMDVFATDAMVKVVADPYVLILDLFDDVDADTSTAYTQPGHVTFRLKKRDRRVWERLNYVGSKAEREARRNKSIEAAHAAAEEQRKAHVQRLKKSKAEATTRQIEIDKKKRQAIEAAKAAELQHEREKLQCWQEGETGDESDCEQMPEASQVLQDPKSPKPCTVQEDHPEYYGKGFRGKEKLASPITLVQKKQVVIEEITSDDENAKDTSNQPDTDAAETKGNEQAAVAEVDMELQPMKLLPPPRPVMQPVEWDAKVQVDFTKLEFPHLPAREKREQELKVYKKAQEAAMRQANSIDVSDRQPIFLKDKGDALFTQGNFHAAVNAYSVAIEREDEDSNLSMLCRLNRSACHSKLAAYGNCIEDCQHVAELLQKAEPAVVEGRHPDPARWKRLLVKALTRRSAAQAHIGEVQSALEGCARALALDPDSVDLQSMQKELEASAAPADWEGLQQRASARYASKQYAAAAEVYSVLAKRPGTTAADAAAALSNEGMCLLCEQKFRSALGKCETAVLLATGMQRLPEHTWVVAWLQGNSGKQAPQETTGIENHVAEAVFEAQLQDDACDACIDCNTAQPIVSEKVRSEDMQKQANLVVKNLGRMASCMAHLKEFGTAQRLYKEAAEGTKCLGLEDEAGAFVSDAAQMEELLRVDAHSGKEAVVDASSELTHTVEEAVAGG